MTSIFGPRYLRSTKDTVIDSIKHSEYVLAITPFEVDITNLWNLHLHINAHGNDGDKMIDL